MKKINEIGLQVLEQVIGNNLWIHYVSRSQENTDPSFKQEIVDAVSGISMTWDDYDEENYKITFAVKSGGIWANHDAFVEKTEEEVDIYSLAIELVGSVMNG